MLHRQVITLAAICCATSPISARAQGVPTFDLAKRTGRTPFSFGFVIGAVGLPDGRVVVSDSKERAFHLVDFAKNEMPMIGGPGDGPLDYRGAGPVLHGLADSLLLWVRDQAGARYISLSPEGKLIHTTPAPDPNTEDRPDHGMIVHSAPLAVDNKGASYYLLELLDSNIDYYELGNIVRVSADSTQQIVVDRIRERGKDQVKPRKSIVSMPFQARDAWALRPDGLGARVVADSYRVVWIRDGHETGRTDLLPYTPIPVTAAEQTAFRDSMIDRFNPKPVADGTPGGSRSSSGSSGGIARMGTTGATTGDNTPRNFTPPPTTTTVRIPDIGPYPETKPAIPNSRWQEVALFDPHGRLWIVRERAHGDNIPHIDVVEEGKGLVAHVNLPKNTRIAGFGPDAVYVINHDNNGDWLERYPMPHW